MRKTSGKPSSAADQLSVSNVAAQSEIDVDIEWSTRSKDTAQLAAHHVVRLVAQEAAHLVTQVTTLRYRSCIQKYRDLEGLSACCKMKAPQNAVQLWTYRSSCTLQLER